MIHNRSWLAGLASKVFPRYRSRAKDTASRHQRSTVLASETLEPRHLLTADLGLSEEGLFSSSSLSSSTATTNNLPELLPSQFFVEHNAATSTLVGTIRGTDADGETLSYEIVSQPNGDSDANDPFVIANTNQLLLNDVDDLGDGSQVNTLDVDIRISDPHGNTDVTIQVVVIPQDTGPTFSDSVVAIDEDVPNDTLVNTLSATYADGGACIPSIVTIDNDNANCVATGFAEGSTFDPSSPLQKSYNRNEFILNRAAGGRLGGQYDRFVFLERGEPKPRNLHRQYDLGIAL